MAAQEGAGPQQPPAASVSAESAASLGTSPPASIEDLLATVNGSSPVSLNLSNDGLNISLSVLDGDLVKQIISALVATVKSQNDKMESMAEEIKQLTEVSRAAVDTVNSMKAKTETVEADLKTLAHNIQGFTEEDLDDGDDDDNLHHQHAAPSSHHRRSSQVRHRSDDSSSAASVDRHAHEHDFGVFIGKLPAAAATDDSVRSLFTSHSGQECADIKSGATSSGGFGIGFFVTAEEAEKAREALQGAGEVQLSDGSACTLAPLVLTKEFLQSKAALVRNLPHEMSCSELKEMIEDFTLEHGVHDIVTKVSHVDDRNCGLALVHFEHHHQVFAMVNDLDGFSFGSKPLVVEWLSSGEQHTLEAHLSRLKKRVYNADEARKTAIIANLPSDLDAAALRKALDGLKAAATPSEGAEAAAVASADVFASAAGKSFGFGVAIFESQLTSAIFSAIKAVIAEAIPGAIAVPLVEDASPPPPSAESTEIAALKQQLAEAAEAEVAAKESAKAAAAEAEAKAAAAAAEATAAAAAAEAKAAAAAAEAEEAAAAAIAQAKAEAEAIEKAAAEAKAEAEESARAAAQAIEDLKAKGDADAAAAAETAAAQAKAEAEAAAAEAAAQAAAATQKAEAEAAAATAAAAKAKADAEALAEAAKAKVEADALAEAARVKAEADALAEAEAKAKARAKAEADALAEAEAKAKADAAAAVPVKAELSAAQSQRAKERWRKAIRDVLRNNKMKKLRIGMTKAKAGKGQSVMERMKRLEDRIYDELVRLQTILKENDAGDKAARKVVQDLQSELADVAQALKTEYALKAEVGEAKEQVLSQLASSSDRISGGLRSVQRVQKAVLKSRVVALGESLTVAVGAATGLAKDIGQVFAGEDIQSVTMDAMAWLQSDWGLREGRRVFADLKTTNVMGRSEIAQLKEEIETEEGDGTDDDGEVKKALEVAKAMLDSLAEALGVGAFAGAGLSATFKTFDNAMKKGILSEGGFGGGGGGGGAGGGDVAAIAKIQNLLAEKVDKTDFTEASSKVEARVEAVETDLGTTNTQVNDQLAQIQATEEKTMDVEKNLSKLQAEIEHDKKTRAGNIERLVKKFVDTFVAKIGAGSGDGGDGEALAELDRRLTETASELRQAVELKASIVGLDEAVEELKTSIDTKADEAAFKELEELLQKMLKDFAGLRKLLEKDTAKAITELEQRLMLVIEERVRTGGTIGALDGAATVKSLISGREIPEQPEKEYDYEQRKLLPRLAPTWGSGEVMRSGFRMPLPRPQTSGGEYGNFRGDFDGDSSIRSTRSPGASMRGGQSQDASWIQDTEFDASMDEMQENDEVSSVGSLTAPADMVYGRGSQHITVPRVPPPTMNNRMAGFGGIEGSKKGMSAKKARRPMPNDTSSQLRPLGTKQYSPLRAKALTKEANNMSASDRRSLSKFDQEGI